VGYNLFGWVVGYQQFIATQRATRYNFIVLKTSVLVNVPFFYLMRSKIIILCVCVIYLFIC